MTVKILADALANELGGVTAAEKTIRTVLTGIKTLVVDQGGEVEMRGFGKFHMKQTAARTGANPRTGEPVRIAAGQKFAFKPSRSI